MKPRLGESLDAYRDRRWAAQELLGTLTEYAKVMDSLIACTRDVYSDDPWHYEGERLKKVVGREVVDTCRQLAALWDLVPAKSSEEDPDDLPF